jgi:hypothetical protein
VSKQFIAGILVLTWMGCQDAPDTASQVAPTRDDVLTEHRPLQAVRPTGRTGDDCKEFGASGCLSGLCLHTKPAPDEGHVCSQRCQSSSECPRDWNCGSPHLGSPERLCIPTPAWKPQPSQL